MEQISFNQVFRKRILPAVTFNALDDVLPVVEAFLNAGLDVMEIPFRTPVAEQAIETIRKLYPQMNVGAGTLLNKGQVRDAVNAGARFGLAPGINKTVCEEACKMGLPFIPGSMTPSEIEAAYEMGFKIQKLFPAEQIGAVSFLKAMQGPYEGLGIQFIPMGGVNRANLSSYLQMRNVLAVGGSWLATTELIRQKNFKQIEMNVLDSLQLTGSML
jgi:2-dehydro-3-deoxyphosphogluconate aldolase / (4S)-4-hydroxy-2-oxoglutarate aldolase